MEQDGPARSSESPGLSPEHLPVPGSPERWPWLQSLRRSHRIPLEPWLSGIEAGLIPLDADLIAALADRLDAEASRRLLVWWLACPDADPALLRVIGRARNPDLAAQLRGGLEGAGPERAMWLLPLLGHQRDPVDFPRLCAWVRGPHGTACRRAALEGLAVGLPCWPRPDLRRLLRQLALDLDPGLAAAAVDLLARLPQPRLGLAGLTAGGLDPAVGARLQRRLAAVPANPLVLVVHGRSGGSVPEEIRTLRADLEARRRSPVLLQVLTAAEPPDLDLFREACGGRPISLMPLLLLPGAHVRTDVPALTATWRAAGAVQRWPFLGAWPAWQQALRAEAAELAGAVARSGAARRRPWLLHHPLQGRAGVRYLAHLERGCGITPVAAAYSAVDSEELTSLLQAPEPPAVLPLVLAANRLTEALPSWCGVPLLQRPRFRDCLLDLLASLP